jgi:hypothetical protein
MVIVRLTAAFLPQSPLFDLKLFSSKRGQDTGAGKLN